MNKLIINLSFIHFNWIVCILDAARGTGWLGLLLVTVWIVCHLTIVDGGWLPEAVFIFGAGMIGFIVDTLLGLAGAIGFYRHSFSGWTSPPFMVALWLSFATGLAFSLRWLQKRFFIGAIFGLFGGPVAYYAGMKLGAIRFHDNPYMASSLIAVAWAIAMPLLLGYRKWIYARLLNHRLIRIRCKN